MRESEGSPSGNSQTTHKARVGRITALGLRQIDVQPAAFTAFGSFASLMSVHVQPVSLAAVPASQLRAFMGTLRNIAQALQDFERQGSASLEKQ